MDTRRYKIDYRGSILWLIFWMIVFFPIALVLLLTSASFEINHKVYNLYYNGSRFWLGFWTIAFFPLAFLLLFLNGLSISVDRSSTSFY